jgi:hypothetical protein
MIVTAAGHFDGKTGKFGGQDTDADFCNFLRLLVLEVTVPLITRSTGSTATTLSAGMVRSVLDSSPDRYDHILIRIIKPRL